MWIEFKCKIELKRVKWFWVKSNGYGFRNEIGLLLKKWIKIWA